MKGSNLKTHKQRRTKTETERIHQNQPPRKSREIRRRHTSTRPPTMLDTPLGQGLGGENFIPSSRSRRRLATLSRTQTLTKLEEAPINKALPPPRAGIHRAPMALRPPKTRQTGGGTGGTRRNPSFLGRRLMPEERAYACFRVPIGLVKTNLEPRELENQSVIGWLEG